jgi:hypothetical protein
MHQYFAHGAMQINTSLPVFKRVNTENIYKHCNTDEGIASHRRLEQRPWKMNAIK